MNPLSSLSAIDIEELSSYYEHTWEFPDGSTLPANDVSNGDLEYLEWTGLKDKTGKEVYEGDIITDDDGEVWPVSIGWMAVDAYDAYGWNIVGFYGEPSDHGTGKRIQSLIEVIGNIHQNKELLQ